MKFHKLKISVAVLALLLSYPFTLSATSQIAPALLSLPKNAGANNAASPNQPATTAAPTVATAQGNNPSLLMPAAPNIPATGYVLMDAYSGKILASKNPDQRMSPASLTKMMTSYIVSAALSTGRIHLDDLVPISEQAWRTGGSKMFVKVGDKVPVRDLMQGMIVDSGNDACVALAEYVAGSQDAFVNIMNQQAALLGMKGTHFMDVNGLPDPGHYTTPRDMAILARALIFDFPQDYQWYSQKWFTYNNIKQPNRNRLLWSDPTVDGIKTGHTDDAGFCLVASAQRHGMRLISVVMGTPSDADRASSSEALLTYGFRFFNTQKIYTANNVLGKTKVYMGVNPEVPVGLAKDLYITIPTGQDSQIKTDVTFKTPLQAPIQKGEAVGVLTVSTPDGTQVSQPLVSLQDNPEGSFWSRLMDRVDIWIDKVF